MTDEFYMQLAIDEAWKYQILTYPNPAVGCVILDRNGKILSIAAHKKAGFLHAEPSAVLLALCAISEEFLAEFIRQYKQNFSLDIAHKNPIQELAKAHLDAKFTYEFIIQNHAGLLSGATAYVTLEPCSHHGRTPPCAGLLAALGFGRVVIAHEDLNKVASGGVEILKNAGVAVKMGVLKDKAGVLLEPFLAWQGGNFSFFKLALSANGVATGGIISNHASRTHMHALRSACDLLVIGGNSVRIDRPTLDTRLIKDGKNPDILIYSRSQNFDQTIPLFSVANRSVSVFDNLEKAFSKGLTMFEGGENFIQNLPPQIRWILIYRSSEFKNGENLKTNCALEPLFTGFLDDGSYIWYRR